MSFRKMRRIARLVVLLVMIAGGAGWYFVQPPVRQQEVNRMFQEQMSGKRGFHPVTFVKKVWTRFYGKDWVVCGAEPDPNFLIFGGWPKTAGEGLTVLKNSSYWVGYDEDRCLPTWVAYKLVRHDPDHSAPPRPDEFRPDSRTKAAITSDHYTGSGYARGHLAPSNGIGKCFGASAQLETFLMSNVVPQEGWLNSGIWQSLERKELNDYANDYGEVWVLAGPVFPKKITKTMPCGLPIPAGFYKILLVRREGKARMLGFMFRQGDVPHPSSLEECRATVDEIEEKTGLDFFPDLPLDVQSDLESRIPPLE